MTVPLEFIYILDVILISRTIFAFQNQSTNKNQTFIIFIIQLAGLAAFPLNRTLAGIVLVYALILIFQIFLEDKGHSVNKVRSLTLALYLISAIFILTANLSFNPAIISSIKSSPEYLLLGKSISSELFNRVLVSIFGLLLITFEANHFIRMVLESSNIAPPTSEPDNYFAGRIIGVLERILIFTFVTQGELSAIAFILAAKSFARFEEMKEQKFAEYVLIGTLLSSVLALAIALLVSKLKIAAF